MTSDACPPLVIGAWSMVLSLSGVDFAACAIFSEVVFVTKAREVTAGADGDSMLSDAYQEARQEHGVDGVAGYCQEPGTQVVEFQQGVLEAQTQRMSVVGDSGLDH